MGLDVLDGTTTAISKYLREREETLSDIFNEKFYINEATIQEAVSKHKGIEFSMTGELIPVEIVEVAIRDFVKKFKSRIKKYYKKDTNILHMSYDLFCLELNMELGEKFR